VLSTEAREPLGRGSGALESLRCGSWPAGCPVLGLSQSRGRPPREGTKRRVAADHGDGPNSSPAMVKMWSGGGAQYVGIDGDLGRGRSGRRRRSTPPGRVRLFSSAGPASSGRRTFVAHVGLVGGPVRATPFARWLACRGQVVCARRCSRCLRSAGSARRPGLRLGRVEESRVRSLGASPLSAPLRSRKGHRRRARGP